MKKIDIENLGIVLIRYSGISHAHSTSATQSPDAIHFDAQQACKELAEKLNEIIDVVFKDKKEETKSHAN